MSTSCHAVTWSHPSDNWKGLDTVAYMFCPSPQILWTDVLLMGHVVGGEMFVAMAVVLHACMHISFCREQNMYVTPSDFLRGVALQLIFKFM